MTIYGTDTSQSVDVAALTGAGTTFSYPRCISEESNGRIDPAFAETAAADRAAGRLTGGYDFLTKDANGASLAPYHAHLFLSATADLIDADPAFMVVLDLEDSGWIRKAADWADVEAWSLIFRARFPNHPIGLYVGAYHGLAGEPDDWASRIGPCYWLLPAYPVSVDGEVFPASHYARCGGDGSAWWTKTRGGKTPAIWQYDGTVSVAGQPCDLNAYRGSVDELRALIGGKPTEDPMFAIDQYLPGKTVVVAAGTVVRSAPDGNAPEIRTTSADEPWSLIAATAGYYWRFDPAISGQYEFVEMRFTSEPPAPAVPEPEPATPLAPGLYRVG